MKQKKRKAVTELRLAKTEPPCVVPANRALAIVLPPEPELVIEQVPPEPAPPPAPGTVLMLSNDEATLVLMANRAILSAQEEGKDRVAVANACIAAANAALASLVERLAVAHGINLDPASGRWHFDVASGSFTRLAPEGT